MGYPAKNLQPAAIAASAMTSLPGIKAIRTAGLSDLSNGRLLHGFSLLLKVMHLDGEVGAFEFAKHAGITGFHIDNFDHQPLPTVGRDDHLKDVFGADFRANLAAFAKVPVNDDSDSALLIPGGPGVLGALFAFLVAIPPDGTGGLIRH